MTIEDLDNEILQKQKEIKENTDVDCGIRNLPINFANIKSILWLPFPLSHTQGCNLNKYCKYKLVLNRSIEGLLIKNLNGFGSNIERILRGDGWGSK